jgi:hypothetical protein
MLIPSPLTKAAIGSNVGVGTASVGVEVGSGLAFPQLASVRQEMTIRMQVPEIRIPVIIPFSDRFRRGDTKERGSLHAPFLFRIGMI